MTNYLIIKNIRAQRVNCLQTAYLISPAPVFACSMLAHAIAARLNLEDLGVGIIHHYHEYELEMFPSTDNNPRPCYFQGATTEVDGRQNDPRSNPIIPTVTGHIHLSLIIQLNYAVDTNEVKRLLRKMRIRIAGGIVPEEPTIFDTDDLTRALKLCGRGFWLSDATATIKERLNQGKEIVEAIMGRIEHSGWHVPAVVGYRALTEFSSRDGVRENLPHAFSEALVGLVRYDSTYKIVTSKEQPTLWQHKWIDESTFIVSQTKQEEKI